MTARRRRQTGTNGAGNPANERDGVEFGVLADLVGFHLRQANDASFRAFARHAGEPRMKPGRFAAMMVIHNNPGISQIALSRAIARDKSSVTPLIQDLYRLGFVSRRPAPRDRRSITLRLTAAGEKMLDELLEHARAHDHALNAIVGADRPALIALLRKITDALSVP